MTAVNLFSLYVVSLDFHLNNLEEKGAKSSEYFQNGITAVITKKVTRGPIQFSTVFSERYFSDRYPNFFFSIAISCLRSRKYP